MAPKKNKQRERQEQSKASSSARAQEHLLASFSSFGSGAPAAPSGFIGFGSFAPATTKTTTTTSASASVSNASYYGGEGKNAIVQTIYDGSDQEITMALKMLGKKGSVTKIKALNSFLAEILPPKKPLEIRSMLGPFVQLYTYEVRDQNDRKVRQLLNEVLFVLCTKMKPKAFAPHLKRLLPYWFLAMHDVNNEAAAQANKAFEALFPEAEARLDVVGEYLEGIMEEFQAFFGKTVDTFDGVPLEADEREERYERCISAAALTLHTIVNLFADHNQIEKLSDASASFTVAGVVTSDKFGRLATSASKHPSFSRDLVRKSTYKALASVVTKAPSIIQAREEAFGKIILGILGDKCPGNHEAMWDAVLNFLQTFPSVWKASASFPKFASSVMFPRLFSQIRHGFYGSARISFPTLLPLLALIPLDVVGDRSKGDCSLYTSVLEQCLKFLESDTARFNERYAIHAFFECITAYFSIFVASEDSTAWLQELPEPELVAKYVGQFEKVLKASLTSVFASPGFSSESNVELYIASLLTMVARLTTFAATNSDVAGSLKAAFLQTLHRWIREVLHVATTKSSVEASRVNTLVSSGLAESRVKSLDAELAAWTLTSTQIYRESLQQLHTLVGVSDRASPVASSSVGQLVTLMNGVYRTIGLDAVLSADETADAHFESHIRSVVQSASKWDRRDAAAKQTIHATLEVCRHFFVAVREKRSFLLQIFRDFGVQYGDMVEATDIIKYALEFPITDDGSQLWLSSGSWKNSTAVSAPASAATPELEALDAIWKGKLLDEFLMISLKGRLDALDGDAFAALLTASLGGVSNVPVVSPDAVVILCHFALQSGPESNSVLVRILPTLLDLFAKIGGDLPHELASVEQKLYQRLFYLAARGSFRVEATSLWESTALPSMKRWNDERRHEFASTLADELNALLLAKTAAGTAFNTNQFSAFTKKYLLLGDAQDQLFSTQFLAHKLDFLHLRCEDADALPLFFDRLLPSLGELCDDDRMVALVSGYYAHLYAERETATIQLIDKLVDIDVVHSLTWFVFHSDADPAAIQSGGDVVDSRIEILHNFLTLDPLYDALKKTPVVDHVLKYVVNNDANEPSREDAANKVHRNLIFANKNSEHGSAESGGDKAVQGEELSAQQSEDLDSLVVAALTSYVPASVKASLLQRLVEDKFEWASRDGLSLVQPLVVSLIRDTRAGEDADAAAPGILAAIRAFIEKLASSAQSNARYYFQFVRLAGACWRHIGDENDGLKSLFEETAYKSVLTRMETVLRPGAYASVETSEWILMTEFLSALPTWRVHKTEEDQGKWESVAKMAITHVIAGKQDIARVTALKLHQRSSAIRDAVSEQDEQLVIAYPHDVLRGRLALLGLLRAMDHVDHEGSVLQELTAQYRETLLSIVLCALSEGLALKAHLVTTYVSTTSAQQSYDLIQLSLAVEESLGHVLHALFVTLRSVQDTDRVRELVLEGFGGVEGLATLFDAERYPMSPRLRALLYILASHSGALRLRAFDASAIDINADDEAATEAALAKSVIPKAVRKALELEFSSGVVHEVHMKRRKQKPQEREDIMGRLLLWDLFLQLFPNTAAATNTPTMIASALSSYAAQHGLLANFLTFCSTLLSQESTSSRVNSGKLVLQDAPLFHLNDLENGLASWTNDKTSVFHLGARVFFRTVTRLPAMVRTWWNDECTRSLRSWAAKYFEEHITPFILSSELEIIQSASQSHSWDAEEMSVKGSRVSREITTTYVKDECALEMVIRVPASYPLRSVEVECTKRIGISEDRWRRWVLQIIKVTASQDGSLLDAVLLWKKNVDKEFEGVEPCPICYSILNPKTMGLPNLPCKTCSNKYHNSCLYKWFNQSGKNKCPICQQPFH